MVGCTMSDDIVRRRAVCELAFSGWTFVVVVVTAIVKANLHLRKCPVSAIWMSPVALHSKSRGSGLPESSMSSDK